MSYSAVKIGAEYGTPKPAGRQRSWRPFQYGRTLWSVIHVKPEGGGLFDDIKTIHKSDDQGKTWEPVLEIANSAGTAFRMEFWVQQVAHHLWILTWSDTDVLTVIGFNCDTEAIDWVGPATGVDMTGFTVFDYFPRSDGSHIVCGRKDAKPHYLIADASAVWGEVTLVDVAPLSYVMEFCLGTADRLHIMIMELLTVNHVWHVSVEADGTQNTLQSVDTDFGFEFFSNMVMTSTGTVVIWGRYRGEEESTVRAASLHALSEPEPEWTKTDTFIPPNNDTYDLIAMDDHVIALGVAASTQGLEYLVFRLDGTWTDWPVVMYQGPDHVYDPHGNKLGDTWAPVFRSDEKFYYFLADTTPVPPCYTEVRLPEVSEYNPWYLPYSGEKWVTLYPGVHNGPWRIGSDLYTSAHCDWQPDLWAHVFRSTDNGRTWKVQDAANAYDPTGLVCYDEERGVLTSAYDEWVTPPYGLALKDFDPKTNTWQPRYALAGDDVRWFWISSLIIKPNGEKVVFLQARTSSVAAGFIEYQLYYTVWTEESDAWTTPLLYTDDTKPPENWVYFRGATLDPATGNIHIIWEYQTSGSNPDIEFYHRVLLDDLTLGPATYLDKDTWPSTNNYRTLVFGPPTVIFSDKVFVLFNKGMPSGPVTGYYYAWVGSPAALPDTWEEVRLVDLAYTEYPGTDYDDMIIGGVVRGGKLIMIYHDRTGPSGEYEDEFPAVPQMWKIESADGVLWSQPELFFDFWPLDSALYNLNLADIGTGMVDGIGVFANLMSSDVVCGLYKCSASGDGDGSGAGSTANHAY